MPQAERVIGCAQRTRQGTALTQRRDTYTRSCGVGKLGADLPSGERAKKKVVGWDAKALVESNWCLSVGCRRVQACILIANGKPRWMVMRPNAEQVAPWGQASTHPDQSMVVCGTTCWMTLSTL